MTEIVTERLRLRPTMPEDYEGLLALVSDYEVVKMTGSWPYPADPDLIRRRCVPADPTRGLRGPVLLGDEIIGLMGIEEGAMGYMFARAHWGHGYATEIGRALIDRAFRLYQWVSISAEVWDDNPASGRVLEKLGFDEIGTGEGQCTARGGVTLASRRFRLMNPSATPDHPPRA